MLKPVQHTKSVINITIHPRSSCNIVDTLYFNAR